MNPVIIEDVISIAAQSVNRNVIVSNSSLRRYLRSPFTARAAFACVISATGLSVDVDYGSKNVVSGLVPRIGTDMQEPQDLHNDEFFPAEGDQLVIAVTNTTGGALDFRYKLVLHPWDGERPPDVRVMGRNTTILANAVDQQLLDGLRYERPPVPSILEVFMTAAAVGLTRRLDVDTDSIAPSSAVAPLNRFPMDPFDKTINGVEVPEDKLISLSCSNSTAGTITAFWKVKLYETVRT